MKRAVPLTDQNAPAASETDVSRPSKKPRLTGKPSSGAADQEPPPKDVAPRDKPEGKDVDMTRGDAPPMEVEEEETTPVAEEVPEEATEEDKRAATGWLSSKSDVDEAVVAAKAAAVAQCGDILTKLKAALEKCGTEGEPGSLEMIPKKELTQKKIQEIIDIKGVEGASYTGLFDRGARKSKEKAQSLVRPRLKELLEEATQKKSVALEKAEVEAQLSLELTAIKALPEDTPDVTTLRSLLACSLLLAEANPKVLTTSVDKTSGNVDELVIAMQNAGVELMRQVDGVQLEDTKEKRVRRVIRSLERALDALPPQEVARAVVHRFKLLKHAPRVDETACAELATTIRDAATGFAARGPESATKLTPDLPPFPTRDPAKLALRREENRAWSAAPPAKLANVHLRMQYDSYVLGTTAPPQKWPKLRGRPTIVGGVELATIKPMDVLAKKLAHGEKCEKGKPGKEESG